MDNAFDTIDAMQRRQREAMTRAVIAPPRDDVRDDVRDALIHDPESLRMIQEITARMTFAIDVDAREINAPDVHDDIAFAIATTISRHVNDARR